MKNKKALNLINFSLIFLLFGCNNTPSSISIPTSSINSEVQSSVESSVSVSEVESSSESIISSSEKESSSEETSSSEELSSSEETSSSEELSSSEEISSSEELSSSEEISSSEEVSSSEEKKEIVGTFEVVSGNDYTLGENSISTSTGQFLLKDKSDFTTSFHLSIDLDLTNAIKASNYGIVLNGSITDGKLTGDLFKPYFDNGWRLSYGTYVDGNYSEIFDTSCDFGSNFTGKYDIYVDNGMFSWRMDGWCVGQSDIVTKSGNTFILAARRRVMA